MPSENGHAVLVVDDEDPFRELVVRRLSREGNRVIGAADGPSALEAVEEEEVEVAILDITMPGMDGVELLDRLKEKQPAIEAVMLTGHGTVETAVGAMKAGAYEYLEKPVNWALLKQVVEKAAEKRRLALENRSLRAALEREAPEGEIVGVSGAMDEVRRLIDRVAPTDSACLVEGESGTGKELVARAIHRRGHRSRGPFIAINCGALQESILENELFGHAKGAYTGASGSQAGLFETANGGVLFIDEVCEMGPGCQKKFLRVLEQGEYRRLGESRFRTCDVRIVAATNRIIEDEVREGRFREDLYFRLNVLRVEIPPLRERPEDIPPLVRHFLDRLHAERGVDLAIDDEAIEALRAYDWPGNVRELQNVIERGAILADGDRIEASAIPDLLPSGRRRLAPSGDRTGTPPTDLASIPLEENLDRTERAHIEAVMKACEGNKTRAAERLGISTRSLYRKLEKHDLG